MTKESKPSQNIANILTLFVLKTLAFHENNLSICRGITQRSDYDQEFQSVLYILSGPSHPQRDSATHRQIHR